MSQQHATQVSGQGILERVFKLREHGTTTRTEAIVGFTTFPTMVYIVFVNPQILGVAGMDAGAILIITCLIAVFGSIMMGLFANLPVALTPTVGLNAFFAFVIVQVMDLPWQVGMGAVFRGVIGLLLLAIFRVRYQMITNIPVSLCVGITGGIDLFIDMMGLKNAGVIVANPETLVSIGSLTSHSVLLGILGFFVIAIPTSRDIHATMLVSIMMTTLPGWTLGDVHYDGVVPAPPSVMTVVGHVDLAGSLNLGLTEVIFSFILVNSFDSSGTLIGVTDKAGLADEKGKFSRMKQALYVDSVSFVIGSLIGTSSVTAYIESSSGVFVGGRAGPTAAAVGPSFLLVIFLSPLAGMVPSYAAAGALIYVGALMTSSLTHVDWQDPTESVPASVAAVVIPFSPSTIEGITPGFISYCVVRTGTKHLHGLNPRVIIIALLFALKIIFIDAHQNRQRVKDPPCMIVGGSLPRS